MSAILEALLNNHEGTDTARPSRADHLGSEVHGEVDLIDLKDPENPRIRNDTPFPSSKMSISSRSENSSFRAHLPIPESPLPKKRGEAGESTSSSPPDDPTTLNSPVRNEQTVDADQTPASAGFSSTYSTPTELLFGPQSLPFVLRRHATTNTADTSPTKQPKTPYLHRPRNTSIPAVIVLSGDDDEDEQNDPDREIEQIVHSMRTPLINGARIPHNAANMSSWRTEQIKYTKRARRGPDSGLKAVPHLHGPLSLPYARNPSGVDATIADSSAYLSHVFGLRAAPPPPPVDSSRSASNTTSGTDSSRSASHGGVVYMRSRPKVQDSRPATGGQSGAHGERPLVVRDPYQNIGIRKGIGMREKTDWTDKQVCTGSDEQYIPMPSRNPSSETAPYTGSTTITSGHLPSASSMLRAQLSIHGAKLSPIPGSPAIELSIEDIPPLYETAGVVARQDLHRSSTSDLQAVRAHQRGTSLPIPSKGANAGTSDSLQRSKASTYQWSGPFGTGQSSAALGASTPTRARGVSQGLQVRSQPLQGSFTSPEAIRTLPPSLAGLSASQPSKADVSEDWRQKSQQEIPAVEIQRPTAPASPQQDTENSPPDVMTIDSLFAKFQKQLSPTIAFSPFTSADPAIKETSPLRLARRTPSNRSIPLERDLPPPLGESSGKAVNIVSHGPMKPVKSAVASASKTTLAKGTPNAGKLLKKATVSAAKEKLPPVPKVPSNAVTAKGVETRGKGKARK